MQKHALCVAPVLRRTSTLFHVLRRRFPSTPPFEHTASPRRHESSFSRAAHWTWRCLQLYALDLCQRQNHVSSEAELPSYYSSLKNPHSRRPGTCPSPAAGKQDVWFSSAVVQTETLCTEICGFFLYFQQLWCSFKTKDDLFLFFPFSNFTASSCPVMFPFIHAEDDGKSFSRLFYFHTALFGTDQTADKHQIHATGIRQKIEMFASVCW